MSKPKTAKKVANKTVAKKTVSKAAKKSVAKVAAKKAVPKKPLSKMSLAKARAEKVLQRSVARRKDTIAATTYQGNLADVLVDPNDEAAQAAIAKRRPTGRIKRSATERLDDPPPATGLALIERVSRAIERELSLVERIVGGVHVKPVQRTEAERRARTLASLARTLTEVRKLRAEEKRNRPDDDAIPRDLDELRRALSRRLEQMVAPAAELPAAGDERG